MQRDWEQWEIWVGVHYEEYLNAARDLTDCHGVSLEGGLVREKVAAVIYQFSPVHRAAVPDRRGF